MRPSSPRLRRATASRSSASRAGGSGSSSVTERVGSRRRRSPPRPTHFHSAARPARSAQRRHKRSPGPPSVGTRGGRGRTMATQPRTGPIKVLVADDNEKARDALIEQLRFEDVQVVGESSLGTAAYTWAAHLDVDLVLVTVNQPV